MTEESEVWEEIRDALHGLAEQEERQTALLEEIVKQGKQAGRTGRSGIIVGTMTPALAMVAIAIAMLAAYRQVDEIPSPVTQWSVLLMLGALAWYMIMIWLEVRRWRRWSGGDAPSKKER